MMKTIDKDLLKWLKNTTIDVSLQFGDILGMVGAPAVRPRSGERAINKTPTTGRIAGMTGFDNCIDILWLDGDCAADYQSDSMCRFDDCRRRKSAAFSAGAIGA